jgi:hypothetical protein
MVLLHESLIACVLIGYFYMFVDHLKENRMTVEQLRKSGYKVRVIHTRRGKTTQRMDGGMIQTVSERGGMTVVQVRTPEGEELEGVALCSAKDNFNRRMGVRIALGRALTRSLEKV